MSQLRQIQRRFQNYLAGLDEEIEKDIVSTEDALAEHRLGAYYNAYRVRLIDILAGDYAAIDHYLGRETFEELALDYLGKFPSKYPSVRWFGQHFAEYLTNHCKREGRDFLIELAEFEWSQGLMFDTVDEKKIFQADDMMKVPADAWASLIIEFVPAMKYLDLYWNVCQYALAVDKLELPPKPRRSEIPLRWLLWRKGRNPVWRSLDVHEAWAMEAAASGENFSTLCEGLCEWISEDQVAITAAGFLRQWISDELVVNISY